MKKIALTILILLLSNSVFLISCCEDTVKVKKLARIIKVGDLFSDGTRQVRVVILGDYEYNDFWIYVPANDNNSVGDTIPVCVKVPISSIQKK